jgi:hypothetical protein
MFLPSKLPLSSIHLPQEGIKTCYSSENRKNDDGVGSSLLNSSFLRKQNELMINAQLIGERIESSKRPSWEHAETLREEDDIRNISLLCDL